MAFPAEITFVAGHYLGLALLAAVSFLLGRRPIEALPGPSMQARIALAMALGLGLIAHLVFLIGLFGLLSPAMVTTVVIIVLAACQWGRAPRAGGRVGGGALRSAVIVVALSALVAAVPILLLPLYPPTQWDAISYHLATAKQYVQHGGLVLTPYLRFAVFPQTNDMLFTLTLLFWSDIGAQLVQFLMMLLTAVMAYAWGRDLASPRVGSWAAALWLGSPVVLYLGAAAYIDVGLTLFVTGAAYAFFRWAAQDTTDRSWLVLAAVLSGLAAGSKYSGLFFLLAFAMGAIHVAARRRCLAHAALFVVVGITVAAPWYVRSAYYTGDPLFPNLGNLVGYSLWSAEDLHAWHQEVASHGGPRSVRALVADLWPSLGWRQELFHAEATVMPALFIALPIVLAFGLARRRTRGMAILVCTYIVSWFWSARVLRYLLPVLPMLGLLTALAIDEALALVRVPRHGRLAAGITAIGCLLLVTPGWLYALQMVRERGLPPVAQAERDAYLTKDLPSYPLYAVLNERRGRDYVLYALGEENMAYFADGRFMGDWFGPARYGRILEKVRDGRALHGELRSLGADYFLLNGKRWGVAPPRDEYWRTHARLVSTAGDAMLFELVAPKDQLDRRLEENLRRVLPGDDAGGDLLRP